MADVGDVDLSISLRVSLTINTGYSDLQGSDYSRSPQMRHCPRIPPEILCALLETITGVGLIVGCIVSFTNKLPDLMLGAGIGGLGFGACVFSHGFCDEAGVEERYRCCILPLRFTFGSALILTGGLAIGTWGVVYDRWILT